MEFKGHTSLIPTASIDSFECDRATPTVSACLVEADVPRGSILSPLVWIVYRGSSSSSARLLVSFASGTVDLITPKNFLIGANSILKTSPFRNSG